jgi:aspartyl-tRNA(Asn)/glutamyl-tRNA(Gln) amidotransferase subunit A
VLLGKTTLSEFAIGLPEAGSAFPVPQNPWSPARWAGGSSGGTAAGVAAGLFFGGLGSDTGGSVRLPAAFCGVTGLKPSRGLVPRDGCIPLAPSLDEVGPLARSARDCALLLEALSGGSFAPPAASKRLRVGVDRRHHDAPGVDASAVDAFEAAVAALERGGVEVVELSIPDYELVSAATMLVLLAEALDCHRRNLRERWNDYGRTTRLRLTTGIFVSGSELVRAQRVLASRREPVARALAGVDAVLTPTVGSGAWALDEMQLDMPAKGPLFTRVWNGLGFPALAVPMGFDALGLPLSLQIAAAPGADARVLAVGERYQSATDWHLRAAP